MVWDCGVVGAVVVLADADGGGDDDMAEAHVVQRCQLGRMIMMLTSHSDTDLR